MFIQIIVCKIYIRFDHILRYVNIFIHLKVFFFNLKAGNMEAGDRCPTLDRCPHLFSKQFASYFMDSCLKVENNLCLSDDLGLCLGSRFIVVLESVMWSSGGSKNTFKSCQK